MKSFIASLVSVFLASAYGGDLPTGYVPLEYLRGTGTQCINTGYYLTDKSRVAIDFTLNDEYGERYVYGFLGAEPAYHMIKVSYSDNKWTSGCGKKWESWQYFSNGQPGAVGAHRFTINDNGKDDMDGYTKTFTPSAFKAEYEAYIFAANSSGTITSSKAKMDLRAFDIYESGTLVRSYRPAMRVSDKALGLYESQEGQFYTNAGTGTFATPTNFIRVKGTPDAYGTAAPDYGYVYNRVENYPYAYRAPRQVGSHVCTGWKFTRADGTTCSGVGETAALTYTAADAAGVLEWLWASDATRGLPTGYLPLDYLRGTGTQYIDMDYRLTSNSRVDIDFTLNNEYGERYIYGVSGTGPSNHLLRVSYPDGSASTSVDKWVVGCGKSWEAWSYFTRGMPSAVGVHAFSLNNGGVHQLDGYVATKTPDVFEAKNSAYLFCCNSGGTAYPNAKAKMDLRAFDIYESGALARSFRPAFRQSDRTAGLYEFVEGKFYTNAGTGNFAPAGGVIHVVGTPAAYGTPSPAYGLVSERAIGTEYAYTAPARCQTAASKARAVCTGWKFTRLDGTTLVGEGCEAKFTHTAADDGGALEWQWTETVTSYPRVNRSVIRLADGMLRPEAALTGFPLLVRVSPARIAGFAYSQCAADGSDVWFSDSPNGLTALPMELDTWNASGESTFWVKVPSLTANSRIYLFWGSEKPVSGGSAWGDYAGVWHCTSAEGNVLADSSDRGNALSPTASGTVSTTADGVVGGAKTGKCNLSLADYQAKVSDMSGDGKTLTCSGWFRTPALLSVTSIYYFYPFSTGSWYCESTAACKGNVTYSGGQPSIGYPDYRKEWMHVAVVNETAKNRFWLYVNGVPQPSFGYGALLSADGKALSFACYDNSGAVAAFDADELRLRASSSTPEWIAAEYAQGANPDFLVCGPMQTFERKGAVLIVR